MSFPRVFTSLLCLLAALFCYSSCAEKAEEKPKEQKVAENRPRIVGRVASIPADRKFVLIQSYGSWKVENGAVLTTQGPNGRAANLLATGEKLGQYAAADIRSGTVEVGDGVYTTAIVPKKPTSTTTETSTKDEEDESDEESEDDTPDELIPSEETPELPPLDADVNLPLELPE